MSVINYSIGCLCVQITFGSCEICKALLLFFKNSILPKGVLQSLHSDKSLISPMGFLYLKKKIMLSILSECERWRWNFSTARRNPRRQTTTPKCTIVLNRIKSTEKKWYVTAMNMTKSYLGLRMCSVFSFLISWISMVRELKIISSIERSELDSKHIWNLW